MKTPSVIKKALASVLSVAMIVAFAPTAAFAIDNDRRVNVSFDANGGTTTYKMEDQTELSVSNGVITLDDEVSLGRYTTIGCGVYYYSKGYAAFDFWFYDANNNDVYDDGDVKVIRDNFENTLNVKDIPQVEGGTTDITLKASYKEISATASTSFSTAVDNYDEQNGLTDVNVTANGLKIGTYMACIDTHGGPVYSDEVTVSAGSQATFCVHVHNYFFKAGDIDVYVVDNSFNKVTGTECKFHICTVTCKAGDYGAYSGDGDTTTKKYLVSEGTKASNLKLASPTPSASYSLESPVYTLEDGSELINSVTRDVTLVAQYNNPKISPLTFYFDSSGDDTYVLDYFVKNLQGLDEIECYKVTILAGSTELTSFTAAYDGLSNETLRFDCDSTPGSSTTDKAAAGIYTVRVEAVYKASATVTTPIVIEKSVTVDEIELDANGGVAPEQAQTAGKALIQAGKTLRDLGFVTSYAYGYTNDDSTKTFAGWSLDGKTVADANKVVAPADGSPIKLKALWSVAKPTLRSATKADDGTYTLTFDCTTEGATLTYELKDVSTTTSGSVSDDGIAGVTPASKVTVTANPPTGSSLNSQSEIFYGHECVRYGTDVAGVWDNLSPLGDFDDFTGDILESVTADDQTAKKITYGDIDAVVAAKQAGDDAIKAKGFAIQKQWKTLVDDQEKPVLDAVVSYAKTQLDALKSLVKSDDGKIYSKLSDSDYKSALKELDAVIEDFEGKDSTAKGYPAADVTKIVTDARAAAAANTFDASDVEAAQAVTTSLQVAKSASAAKSAIEAYKKLTDIQKSFVDIDDVIAAYKVIVNAAEASAGQASSEAATALKEAEQAKKDAEQAKAAAEQAKAAAEQAAKDAAQAKDEAAAAEQAKQEADIDYNDLLAASKLTKMKVVAKAEKGKKARGKAFSYNLAASASGAKATYAKVYGSKYISVSANGKVTFAKVKATKKTKKFKARVSVTFGTQTVKKNIWYVVKKK